MKELKKVVEYCCYGKCWIPWNALHTFSSCSPDRNSRLFVYLQCRCHRKWVDLQTHSPPSYRQPSRSLCAESQS